MLIGGLSAVLFGLAATGPEADEVWRDRSPLATCGCPGLDRQVAFWRRELALPAWTIEAECGLAIRDSIGFAWSQPERRRATILVREGLTTAQQHRVVIHELVHVGIAAGRWTVPAGREEEEFVLELADSFL